MVIRCSLSVTVLTMGVHGRLMGEPLPNTYNPWELLSSRGLPRASMGLPWAYRVYSGVGSHGSTVGSHGLPWVSHGSRVGFNESPVGFHGSPVGFNGFHRILLHGLPWVSHGLPWT